MVVRRLQLLGFMNPASFHLLVAAEDDPLRRSLLNSLTAAGFTVEQVGSGREAIDAVRQRSYDLVLLNPGDSPSEGAEICRSLRALSPDLGIVVVQAGEAARDEALALDAGADDCIAAPFRFREIVARLGAILRRTRGEPPSQTVFRAGSLELDPERRRLLRDGREVHLSPREFDLLFYLMSHPEEILTHVKTLRAVWGNDAGHDPGYLRTYIKTLRRKIEEDPVSPRYILTVPWVGYRFHDPSAG
jgi:two-component system KDP operon response regulator KdpE